MRNKPGQMYWSIPGAARKSRRASGARDGPTHGSPDGCMRWTQQFRSACEPVAHNRSCTGLDADARQKDVALKRTV